MITLSAGQAGFWAGLFFFAGFLLAVIVNLIL